MNNQQPPQQESTEEIDLGQLFQMIKNGFKSLFKNFLKVFVYFKRNGIKLIALGAIGVGIGLVLNLLISKNLKTEVIVRSNFESKDYLYNVIEEIEANIETRDTLFFQSLDIDVAHLRDFEIAIETIEENKEEETDEEDLKYLELLQNFKDQSFALDIIKSEVFKKSVVNHRITFEYTNALTGSDISTKLLNYLNDNTYFKRVGEVYRQNIASRIAQNTQLIEQIDELVSNYSKGLASKENTIGEGKVYVENENGLNIPSLLTLKTRLVKEIEEKRIDLITTEQTLNVINVGKTQEVIKPVFNRSIVFFPTLFIGLFLLFSWFGHLNKKAKDLQL